jgi:hypothetical protein
VVSASALARTDPPLLGKVGPRRRDDWVCG